MYYVYMLCIYIYIYIYTYIYIYIMYISGHLWGPAPKEQLTSTYVADKGDSSSLLTQAS